MKFSETWWKLANEALFVKKTLFGFVEMHYSDVSACP